MRIGPLSRSHFVTYAVMLLGRRRRGASHGAAERVHDTRFSGGAVHLPSIASVFGQYRRMAMKKGPFGAVSHLASLCLPGDSFCMYSDRPPSASFLNCGNIGELSR